MRVMSQQLPSLPRYLPRLAARGSSERSASERVGTHPEPSRAGTRSGRLSQLRSRACDAEAAMEFPEHSRQLLECLSRQRTQGFLCDCTVLVGPAEFRAHRAVLASCSGYFHLFCRDAPLRAPDELSVRLNADVVTASAFGALLAFMYEGRLRIDGLPVEDVLAAASYLHMHDIVKVCKQRLRDAASGDQEHLGGRIKTERFASPLDLHHNSWREGDRNGEPKTTKQLLRGVCKISLSCISLGDRDAESSEDAGKSHGEHAGLQTTVDRRITSPRPLQLTLGRLPAENVLDLSFRRGWEAPTVKSVLVEEEMTEMEEEERIESRLPMTIVMPQNSGRASCDLSEKVPSTSSEAEQEEEESSDEVETSGPTAVAAFGLLREPLDDPLLSCGPGALLGPSGMVYACPLCGQAVSSPQALQLHLSLHFGERGTLRAERSNGCAPGTGGVAMATVSMEGSGGEGDVPTCSTCRKTFSCAYTLRRHERTHSGEKPYTCAQCGKAFQYSHNLTRHAVVHTREKPHACKWCERRFTQSGDLYRHIRKFHAGLVGAAPGQ
uniref:zinc finger and BTB domain-containing protein 42-like isoform X1 n=1 Tax=Myxine glutinosa TaxID=7769 RepID=UPI00358E9AAE